MDFSLRSAERSAALTPTPHVEALTPSRWEGNPTFSLLGIWLWFSQLK
jgi:hypothetical protein